MKMNYKVLSTIFGIMCALATVVQTIRFNNLQEEWENARHSFDVSVQGNDLIIESNGEGFTRPKDLAVRPIFFDKQLNKGNSGRKVSLPIQDKSVSLKNRRIVIPNIYKSVCNPRLDTNIDCSNISALEVYFSVNGTLDMDFIQL